MNGQLKKEIDAENARTVIFLARKDSHTVLHINKSGHIDNLQGAAYLVVENVRHVDFSDHFQCLHNVIARLTWVKICIPRKASESFFLRTAEVSFLQQKMNYN